MLRGGSRPRPRGVRSGCTMSAGPFSHAPAAAPSRCASPAPEGDLETSGGAIEAEFDEKARLNLEAETSGGRVRVEDDIQITGSITSNRVEGRINGGGPSLRLKTSGGNVRVRLR